MDVTIKMSRKINANVNDTDEGPCCFFQGFVVFLVIANPVVVIFDGLVWIPSTVLDKKGR